MDSKAEYLKLESVCANYIPKLNHHSKESLYRPEENFLKIKIGEEVIRTIKEEDAEIMWYSGKCYLEGYIKQYMGA